MSSDPYYKKTVEATFAGRRLRFRVAHDLFSSHEVDEGTALLLRHIQSDGRTYARVLDLGCGYGAIGVTLRALGIADGVTMADRDALAVEFARQNAALNGTANVECLGSLGFEDLGEGRFDLVAMNVPAKAGERAIAHLLRRAGGYLSPGGEVAVVVVAAIADFVRDVLASTTEAHVLGDEPHRRYSVLRYEFEAPPSEPAAGFVSGVYDAHDVTVPDKQAFKLRTVRDVPGEDGPDGATRLLIAAIEGMDAITGRRAACFHPAQGYGALACAALGYELIELIDRDLLALRATARNLASVGCDAARVAISHVAGFPAGGEALALICGVLREDEGREAIMATIEAAASRLARDGALVVAGSSTGITRVERIVRVRRLLHVERRERKRGASAMVLRPPRN